LPLSYCRLAGVTRICLEKDGAHFFQRMNVAQRIAFDGYKIAFCRLQWFRAARGRSKAALVFVETSLLQAASISLP
jgi:hypothetical protein